MSDFTPKDNSGLLFRNERKEQPSHADYEGTAMVNGQEYWMNAWIKDGKKGKFMSFSFRSKAPSKPQRPQEKRPVDDDSDLPF
jgi:hypothetical protein